MRLTAVGIALLVSSFAFEAKASDLLVWPAPALVVPDDDGRVEVELVVINDGLVPAHEVLLSDALAPGATLVTSEPPALLDGDELRWALGTLGPGESARVRLTLEGGGDLGAEVRGVIAAAPTASAAIPIVIQASLDEKQREALLPTYDANARDPRVLAVVARRGGDIAALLDHVREEIGFEAYRGSLRGARGTLASGAGNSFDQASLAIALLRAAGVPARYGRTTLDDSAAGALINSMFDEPSSLLAPLPDPDELSAQLADREAMAEIIGPELAALLPEDPVLVREQLFPDPALDDELLAVTRDHVFVELFSDGIWTPIDVTQALIAPVAASTFVEIDDGDRHLVALTVTAEHYHLLFGGLGMDEQPVLAEVIPTAALAGRPLSIQHDVVTSDMGGLVFSTITHTYIPQLYIEDELFSEGIAFQELLSNFPGGTQVITGVFVDVELFSPDGEVHTARSTVVDRIGPAGRNGYGDVTVDIGEEGNPPAFGPLDVMTVAVSPAWTDPLDAMSMKHRALDAAEQLSKLVPAIEAIEDEGGPSPSVRALTEHALAIGGRAQRALTGSMAFGYSLTSDGMSRSLAEAHLVKAYPREARVAFFGSNATEMGPGTSAHLARDEVFAVAPAGISSRQVRSFVTGRSLLLGKLEGDVVATTSDANVISYETVFAAAVEQGIGVRTIAPGEFLLLERLMLPDDATAAIRNALAAERLVLVPEAPVAIGANHYVVWLEYDPRTGRLLPVDTGGRLGALLEYSFQGNALTAAEGVFLGVFAGWANGTLLSLASVLENMAYYGFTGDKDGYGWVSLSTPEELLASFAVCMWGNDSIQALYGIGMDALGGNLASALLAAALELAGKQLIAANPVGTKAFVTGAKVGLCLGEWAAAKFASTLFNLVLEESDPPLPFGPLALAQPGTPSPAFSSRAEGTTGGLPRGTPPSSPSGVLRVSGDLGVEVNGTLALDGTNLISIEGAWARDGVELEVGTFEVLASSITLSGTALLEGEASLTAFEQGASMELRSAQLSLHGDLVVVGQRADDSEPRRYQVSAAVATAAEVAASVTLPATYELTLSNATVAQGQRAWLGTSGTLVVDGLTRELSTEPSDRLELTDLPTSFTLERGERAHFVPTMRSTSTLPGTLSARAPEGWRVMKDEGSEGFFLEALPGSDPGAGVLRIGFTRDNNFDDGVWKDVPLTLSRARDEVSIELEHNPLFTTTIDEQPVPLVLGARITHRAEGATSYALTASANHGLSPKLPMSTLHLDAGESTLLLFGIQPDAEPLPSPATPITVTLSLDDGTRQGSASHTFPMPEVWGAHASFSPATAFLQPGESVETTLRLVPTGNASGTLEVVVPHLQSLTSSGVPSSLTLTEELEIPVVVTLQPGARPGLQYGTAVELRRGEAVVARAALTVHAAGELESRLLELAAVADELGLSGQREQWLAVSRNYDAAVTACSPQRVATLAQSLDGLANELVDTAFQTLRTELRMMTAAWSEAGMSCDAFSAEDTMALLEEIGAFLTAIRHHDFRIDVSPRSAVATLGEQVAASVRLEQRGAHAGDIALEVIGLPASVASPVTPAPLLEDHPLLLEASEQGHHVVRVRATSLAAPALVREANIVLSVGDVHVRVTKVGTTARFPVPGATLPLFIDVGNTRQLPQSLEAHLEVRRPDGTLLYESPEPVPLELPVSAQVHRFAVGSAETFGEPAGAYAVHVTLSRPGGGPLVGGEAEDVILLGQPFDVRAGVVPSPLPPGELDAEVRVELERRPWNVLPGLANVEEIVRMTSDSNGPSDVWVRADGYAFVTNFGTRRVSSEPGYVPSDTLSRVHPDGTVEQFAVVGEAPTGVTECPDGMLYTVNVGKPERIMRVDPDTGETSIFHEFHGTDEAHGENIVDIVCADDGTLYATEYYDPFIFGIVWPGRWIYAIHPDLDEDGRSDGAEIFIEGLQRPASLTIDRRTGDLIVAEEDGRRVVRVNTVGTPEIVELIPDIGAAGFHLDDHGNLLVVEGRGSIRVWETVIVDGHTEVIGDGELWLDGLHRPGNLERDPNGDLWTTAFESNGILRIALSPPSPAPPVTLSLSHTTVGAGVVEASAFPDLGADGPTWANGSVSWTAELGSSEETLSFGYTHALSGLEPGEEVVFSSETTATLTSGDDVLALSLPAIRAQVGRFLTLEPARVTAYPGTGVMVQVTLHNLSPVEETYTLSLPGLPASFSAELEEEVVVPPGEVKTVSLLLLVDPSAPENVYAYTVRAEGSAGVVDNVSGELEVAGAPLEVRLEPVVVEGRYGEVVELRIVFRREADDPRRGFSTRIRGLPSEIGVQHNGLLDFYGAPLVDDKREKVETSRFTLRAREGSYPFRVEVTGLIPNTPGWITVANGVVRVTNDVGVTVRPIPEEQTIGRGMPFTLTARIENHSATTRSFRLERCCGPAYWLPQFDAGPHTLGPGEVRFVPIRMRPNAILAERYSHRLTATDIHDASVTHDGYGYVNIATVPAVLGIVEPKSVVANDGSAQFTVRISRAYGGQPGDTSMQLAVDGPLGFAAELPELVHLPAGSSRVDVPLTLTGLTGLAPGPWGVRVTGFRPEEPDVLMQDTGFVTIPSGGVVASFAPTTLHARTGYPAETSLSIRSHDFTLSRQGSAVLTGEANLDVAPVAEHFSLSPGGQHFLPVRVLAEEAGTYRVDALITTDDGEVAAAELEVVVIDNHPPSAPVAVAPLTGSSTGSHPALIIEAASDPDGDDLSYLYELLDDDGLPLGSWLSEELQVAIGPLSPGPHRWRARALDGYELGPWSEEQRFLVDLALDHQPPSAPEIIAPSEGEELDAWPVVVEWLPALDPDGDPLVYDVEIAADEDFSALAVDAEDIVPDDDGRLLLEVSDLSGGATYFARVRARDALHAGPWAEVSFSLVNRAPPIPELLAPVDGVTVPAGEVELRFSTVEDPDGHALTYRVQVFEAPDAEEALVIIEDLHAPAGEEELSAFFDGGDTPARYFWTAEAIDELGLSSGEAIREELNVEQVSDNRPPPPPVLLYPAEGDEVPRGTVELVLGNVSDPDGDALRYELRVSNEDGLVLHVPALPAEEGDETKLEVELSMRGEHVWEARSVDARGLESEWVAATFLVTPNAVDGSAPGIDGEKAPGEGPGGATAPDSCGCRSTGGSPGWPLGVAGTLLLALFRRQQSRSHRKSAV